MGFKREFRSKGIGRVFFITNESDDGWPRVADVSYEDLSQRLTTGGVVIDNSKRGITPNSEGVATAYSMVSADGGLEITLNDFDGRPKSADKLELVTVVQGSREYGLPPDAQTRLIGSGPALHTDRTIGPGPVLPAHRIIGPGTIEVRGSGNPYLSSYPGIHGIILAKMDDSRNAQLLCDFVEGVIKAAYL